MFSAIAQQNDLQHSVLFYSSQAGMMVVCTGENISQQQDNDSHLH
jgi:hypothetical protein